VARNRIRRQLRSHLASGGLASGAYLVSVAPGAGPRLRADVDRCLERLAVVAR
jgi:hypothetical protein